MIRLRTPDEGECVVDDLVRGEVRFEYAQLGDHVIVRSDGVPTYNFANPIDDADMQHHARDPRRGPAQLDAAPGARATRASARRCRRSRTCRCSSAPTASASRSGTARRASRSSARRGYLAEAVVNFLALLGWHFDSERELFTREELIGLFSLERVNPAPAVFDAKKLEWMNGVYLRALPIVRPRRAADRVPRASAARRSPRSPSAIVEVTPLAQEKIATLAEFEPLCAFLFGPVEIDQEAWERVAGHERAAEILAAVQAALADCEWTVEAIEAALRGVCEQLALKPRVVFGLVRVAITGTSISPGPVRERAPARPRRDARAAGRGRRAPLTRACATRWATTAASACAPAENARPSREASAPSAAPAGERARRRARPARPGSAAQRAQRELRGAAGGGVVRARALRAMSERVRPQPAAGGVGGADRDGARAARPSAPLGSGAGAASAKLSHP